MDHTAGFCLIPAIYAIPNIKVSWDPYSKANTSRLPIAVVNDDEGSTVNGKQLNVGDQIVGQLRQTIPSIGLLPTIGREITAWTKENITP